MESVVHLPLATIVILPRIQYVNNAVTGMYKSGALTSCRGDLNGWPPVICNCASKHSCQETALEWVRLAHESVY